jgi:hypothetical protein
VDGVDLPPGDRDRNIYFRGDDVFVPRFGIAAVAADNQTVNLCARGSKVDLVSIEHLQPNGCMHIFKAPYQRTHRFFAVPFIW